MIVLYPKIDMDITRVLFLCIRRRQSSRIDKATLSTTVLHFGSVTGNSWHNQSKNYDWQQFCQSWLAKHFKPGGIIPISSMDVPPEEHSA